MISLTKQVKDELDNLLQSNQVNDLLAKLKDEFSNIQLKNIPNESIENLKLQLETLDAKIEHVKKCASKSERLKYDDEFREKYKESLNKINKNIKEKWGKLGKLTQLKQEIDEILSDSNISLTDLKPKDYPKLKETIQTLEDKYSKLNSNYQNLRLRTKLTRVIEERLSKFKTALENQETLSKSKKTKIIKKAKDLISNFDKNKFNQFSQELYTDWDNYGKRKQTKILTSLFNSALTNRKLNLLNQLYDKFQDNAQAKTIIHSLWEKSSHQRLEILFEKLEKDSESLLKTYTQ